MRKITIISTLIHQIETQSSRDLRSRQMNSFSAWLVSALSIPSSDMFLAGETMWRPRELMTNRFQCLQADRPGTFKSMKMRSETMQTSALSITPPKPKPTTTCCRRDRRLMTVSRTEQWSSAIKVVPASCLVTQVIEAVIGLSLCCTACLTSQSRLRRIIRFSFKWGKAHANRRSGTDQGRICATRENNFVENPVWLVSKRDAKDCEV